MSQEINCPQAVDIVTVLPICKVDAPQRLITAVVLEPWDGDPSTADEQSDTQDDVVTAEEIEKAMIRFMKKMARGDAFLGFMHGDDPADLVLIENWQTRVDMTLGDEEVKAGTWLMTIFVADDELQAGVESGELDGLSIRGKGFSTEV